MKHGGWGGGCKNCSCRHNALFLGEAAVKVIAISSLIFALPQEIRSIKWSINLFKCLCIKATCDLTPRHICRLLSARRVDRSPPSFARKSPFRIGPRHPLWKRARLQHLMDIRNSSKSFGRFWSRQPLLWKMCHLLIYNGEQNVLRYCASSSHAVLIEGKIIWRDH